ncbi:hypothetical protein [Fusibacter sp. 3D3]|uniref:hypothetical protein n=1 Tax=Fusibacter sp. 3D3 TaxID=1048380 RepID=UPI000852A9A4|nr:hypothetical protein [Fusibacter sp. 3D3]GAU78782.1 rhoptry protein [Fusibacter sp. 3D3]
MRITQNQVIQNSKSVESTRSEQGKVLIGKTLEGVVSAINGNRITLLQNGQLLNLINDSSATFETNQKVQLLITGSNEGTLTAVPMNTLVQEDLSGQALEKFGVLSDSVNREIAEAMIKFDVPLTKENFNTMKQNLTAATAFTNDLQMSPDKAALIDVGKTLKENVLNFIKFENTISMNEKPIVGSTNNEMPILSSDQKSLIPEQNAHKSTLELTPREVSLGTQINLTDQVTDQERVSTLPVSSALTDKTPSNSALQNMSNEAIQTRQENQVPKEAQVPKETQGVDASKAQEVIVKALMKDLVNVLGDKPVETFSEVANKLVDLFDLEENAAFTKHNLEFNLTNLFVMNQLKFTEKSVGNSFFELLKRIENSKLSENELLSLQAILQEDINEVEKLNKVANFLKSISENAEAKEKIDKEVLFIKDASQMTKQLNEPLFYMQVPFKLEDYERPVDIYYRRKKASDDKDEFTILVALKTKNYQEVKCVIEKRKEHFILNFKLANDEIKTVFESKSKSLEQQLSEKSITLKFSIQQAEEPSIFETPKQGSIDIKV